MYDAATAATELRLLLVAPTAHDSRIAESMLERAGVLSLCCRDLAEVSLELERGAAAVLVPEEAVEQADREYLSHWLAKQPPWSDLPVLVLARPGADSAAVAQAMDLLGNVTVLERPIRVAALVSAVRTALRARRRQYQARGQLEQIERSERKLRDFFENAAVGLDWISPDGIILRANRAELAMLGYAQDEYVGHHVAEFHVDRAAIEDMLARLGHGETLNDQPARLRCQDGTIKDVLIDASVLWEHGRFVHARCFTRDVTDHKRAEDALKDADRRKDEFLAMLAHELRNPLAPIRHSLHILRMSAGSDPASGRVGEMMERQVNYMVRLVDDLMEVSRITRGMIELRKEPLTVAAVVRSAIETSRPLIEAGHHRLEVRMPVEPLALEGDPIRLTQVIANLLNNAAKYTDEGGHILLSARAEDQAAVIRVRDNGAGIPPEMVPRVFDLFAQIAPISGGPRGGLGIGLTLAKRLVEMHGGRIEARSEGPGKGAEFVVRLPLAVASQDPMARHRGSFATLLAPRRVLVVDDNQDAAESLAMLLRLLGAEVGVAYGGAAAMKMLASFHPSVMLLDIGMPGMDGYEVARRVRADPALSDVLLIAVSGWGQEEDRRRSQSAGFDHHLIKPADVSALEALFVALERRAERHAVEH